MATVLYVSAHPDDETLSMGMSVIKHLAAGHDVHVLHLTQGEGSSVLSALNGTALNGWWGLMHVPGEEGYAALSPADLGAARLRESRTALRCMAADLGALTIHQADPLLVDGFAGSNPSALPVEAVAAARAAILTVADLIASGAPVRLKGHTYLTSVETHPDHLAVGAALRGLWTDFPTRFGDLRHYVSPTQWTNPAFTGLPAQWDTTTDTSLQARLRHAAAAFNAWCPEVGAYAVGEHSVASMFASVLAGMKSGYHAP